MPFFEFCKTRTGFLKPSGSPSSSPVLHSNRSGVSNDSRSEPVLITLKPFKTLEERSQLVTGSMAVQSSTSSESHASENVLHRHFFLWREFLWGAVAGALGDGMMHPVDTVKTRLQSQAILNEIQNQKNMLQMVRYVWQVDGLKGFYRGVTLVLLDLLQLAQHILVS